MAKENITKCGVILMAIATFVLGITLPSTPWIDENRAVYVSLVALGALLLGIVLWFAGIRFAKEKTSAKPLEDIKSDLVALSAIERDIANTKLKTPCSSEKATQICNDFLSVFGSNVVKLIKEILQKLIDKGSVDSLIDFFTKLAGILDSNQYGLKVDLGDSKLYKSSRANLDRNRVNLKIKKKKKQIIQKNIDRVRLLSYGLNSSVILRNVLGLIPEEVQSVSSVLRITLEGIENAAEQSIRTMLDDLENEWKISKKTKKSIEGILPALSLLEGISDEE